MTILLFFKNRSDHTGIAPSLYHQTYQPCCISVHAITGTVSLALSTASFSTSAAASALTPLFPHEAVLITTHSHQHTTHSHASCKPSMDPPSPPITTLFLCSPLRTNFLNNVCRLSLHFITPHSLLNPVQLGFRPHGSSKTVIKFRAFFSCTASHISIWHRWPVPSFEIQFFLGFWHHRSLAFLLNGYSFISFT